MKTLATSCLLFTILMQGIVAAQAESSGPDLWDVTGVRADDVLNLHADANVQSKIITGIPHDATGLKNLGCTGEPTFAEWQRMTEAERKQSTHARWCKVGYHAQQGWVAGRFLKEAENVPKRQQPTRHGAWEIACEATCVLEQRGRGSKQPALLRIEPREGSNAQISIIGPGIPKQGTLTIYMDGETISQGPIAPFAEEDGHQIVMPPDDITAGLLRQMARRKNMVLSFPGEERGVEIQLEHFEDAWRKVLQQKG